MTQKIKTGILSFGMSGKLFQAPFIDHHPGFDLQAVVERSTKQAHLTYPEINSYTSVKDLLADPEIDLVVVNTPNATHFDFAQQALQARKHVLLEKPFTITTEDAQQLFTEAKNQQRCLMAYQNRRHDSDFLSVKKVLESGKLGKLVEAHIRYDRYKYGIGPKMAKETALPGSGLLYDLGPHILDAAMALFGIPDNWTKYLGQFRPGTQVEDYAHIHLIYPEGLQVFVTTSLLVADPSPAFVLHGTTGSYKKHRVDIQEQQLKEGLSPSDPNFGVERADHQGLLTTVDQEGNKTEEQIASDPSSYGNLFEEVYRTIREGKPYPVTEQHIIKQLEILQA